LDLYSKVDGKVEAPQQAPATTDDPF